MSDVPFYSPDRGPAPPRQPQPGEEVWRLAHDGRVQTCELRDDSKAGAGWDVMILEDGEPLFSTRCVDEKGDNTRKGFFEAAQFRAVVSHLPERLRPVAEVAYQTGWRVRSELLTRKWAHVDFAGGWLRLEPGETKNGEGRMFPLTPMLRTILEKQREHTTTVEREKARIIPWLFHRNGKQVRDFRDAWQAACRRAGCPGRILHDFRRTAVRNLERAGVPRSAAMAMVGHCTESIYRRYAIVDEAMLKDGAELLAEFQQAECAAADKRASGEQGK